MLLLLLLVSFTLVAGRDLVQDHEIVYPRMIVSRSGEKRVLFRAFDQDFHLRLEPTDILSDDFVLITRDDDGEVYLKPDVQSLKQNILQDPDIGATIAVDDTGPLQIKGIINEELRIEPVRNYDAQSIYKWKCGKKCGKGGKRGKTGGGHKNYGRLYDDPSQDEDQERELLTGVLPHRVKKIVPRSDEGGYFDEVIPPGKKGKPSNSTIEERQNKRIVLEIAIVSDRMHSNRFSNDQDCITYHAILTNCAALRFKTMKNIQVDFKLVKVKRNKVASDEPYVVNNMYDGHILSGPLIYDFAKYCSRNSDLRDADIVKFITARPMGDKQEGSNKANPGVVGIAFVGGVCDRDYKYGVSEDNGLDFDGSSTYAHEVAHLVGCPHDGDPPVSYLPGSPGAKSCSWDLGYIMSYVRKNEKQFAFSPCSEECVSHLATLSGSECLFRQDVTNSLNNRENRLPGDFFSDTIGTTDMKSIYEGKCKIKRKDFTLYKTPSNSCDYSCKTPTVNNRFYYWIFQCSDGDICDTNKVCINGICSPKK